MNTRTAAFGPSLNLPRATPGVRLPAARTGSAPRTDWMTRLAAWAERQPTHHRMGSWERLGHAGN